MWVVKGNAVIVTVWVVRGNACCQLSKVRINGGNLRCTIILLTRPLNFEQGCASVNCTVNCFRIATLKNSLRVLYQNIVDKSAYLTDS